VATTLLALLAGTQSETIPPWWDFQHDGDTSRWQGAPLPSRLIRPLLTSPKVFAAPGQAPTKFWRYDYDVNSDAALWSWKAPPSWPIRLLTDTKFYSALGQAPTKLWHWDYDAKSETTFWSWKVPPNSALTRQRTFFSGAWLYEFDNKADAVWQWRVPPNGVLARQKQPKVFKQWDWHDLTADCYWQWRKPYNVTLAASYQTLGPLNYRVSEPDDFASWQWIVPFNINLFGTVTPPTPPVTTHPGWPGRRRWTLKEFEEDYDRRRPFTRAYYEKLRKAWLAQQAAEKRAAQLEKQKRYEQAEQLAQVALDAELALQEAQLRELGKAQELTALTNALNAAAGAKKITSQIASAEMRLAAFNAYLAELEDEDDTIVLLLS
jgi:hypothetical protein